MNNCPAFKIFGLTFLLSILASSAIAETQDGNMFLPSVAPAETITVAFKGKPPYRNRSRALAKVRAQQAAWANTEKLEKIELSAMEMIEKDDKSPISRKSTRKTSGHPYHR